LAPEQNRACSAGPEAGAPAETATTTSTSTAEAAMNERTRF